MNNKTLSILIWLLVTSLSFTGCDLFKPEVKTVADPQINPPAGEFNIPQIVSIVCATQDAAIYYTTNGEEPGDGSTLYSEPFTLTESSTIKAIAFKDGYNSSEIVSAEYEINLETVTAPVFDPPEGSYDEVQTVSIICETEGATIRYTIDGSVPDESSLIYTTPLLVSETAVLGARAYKENYIYSDFVRVSYEIDLTPAMEMVLIPAGTVTMGDTRGEGYNDDQYPTHTIHINAMQLGKYEVTQSQYLAIMGSLPETSYGQGDSFPVYGVSWYSAIKYCNLLSLHDGYTPVYSISGTTNPEVWGEVPQMSNPIWNAVVCNWSADGYRLPTEAEWEYVARGATMNPDYVYSGSNTYSTVAWCMTAPANSSHEVGQKAPNGLGLYDMSGNVFEWCWDWYFQYSGVTQNNPHGPASGTYRVMRGGAWNSMFFYCSVFYRSSSSPHLTPQTAGLRVCRNA